MNSTTIVEKLWNYYNVFRDDGISCGDSAKQLTYLLFLKIAFEGLLEKQGAKSGAGQYFSPCPLYRCWPKVLMLT